MLSMSDFKEKQILFIQSDDFSSENKIQINNDNISFSKDGKVVNRLSCSKILCVFVIGDLSLTTVLIRNSLKAGISLFLLKKNFEVYASMGSAAEGNYLLREKQYGCKDELSMAKKIVENKISNQIALLKSKKSDDLDGLENFKKDAMEKIKNANDDKELLGIEGNSSKYFFGLFFEDVGWYKRMPRTKIDHYNILLDIGYTFLFNYIDSLLRIYGFDVYKGFYHKLFFQRKSLTCDIVEPFRCIIDRQLLKSFNLKQINEKDFKYSNGKYYLGYDKSQKYAKIFFDAILSNKEEIFIYVKDYYRHIMAEENDFPTFEIK